MSSPNPTPQEAAKAGSPKLTLKQKLVKLGNTPVPLPPIPGLARLSAAGSSGYVPPEYMGQRSFAATIAFAALLHIGAVYIWAIIPRTEVINIPVRALSIKLSDGEPMTAEEIEAAQQDTSNSSALESALNQAVDPMQQQARSAASAIERALNESGGNTTDPAAKAMEQALANTPSELSLPDPSQKMAPKQFVRMSNVQAKSGSTRGNSTAKDAELMKRYEQLISLWIEKFKQYPMEARQEGLQGETVVRIRIDRKGNIRYYLLERSTGHPILDRAAIDMVRRANPVPAVPNDYPKGDLIEFLIPVNFQLQ